jgi:adenylate cyclase
MPQEIERKFLVRDDRWRPAVYRSERLRQGYLVSDATRSVRIRITGDAAHLNIKSATLGVSRSEYEYPIPLSDAGELLEQLCRQPLLEKTRHWLRYGEHVWEVDVFDGDNAGLIVAEVELSAPDEDFARPPWLGEEVSHDRRYYNSCLAEHPYQDWRD